MPTREMLINYVPGEECRIAIVEDGRLEELYQERASSESHVGNIYKGRVVNVEPSIQAAFVDFGLERNGFLHISDLHPMYFPGQHKEELERVGEKTPRRDRPPIQRCLRRGQEVLVQVLKEGIGTKGPTLTSYLSIPGRFLVMMPHMERAGVSRKVEDDEARRAMRKILDELNLPTNFGWILRTAAEDRPKTDLKRDAAYLQRLWKTIDHRRAQLGAVGELHTESDLVIRTIRDIFSTDIARIIVDHEIAARRAADFLAVANPRSRSNVMVYRDAIPLFHRYDIEKQIESINARTVPLPSGGSLVIDSTEALVAIDVNSGKMRDNRDAETTAYKTNLEAADEICRQLRLRDLGGVIVNDLIDMRDPKHRRAIEQKFRNNLKNDRARTRTVPISQFGILEMTRQRMRPSLKTSIYAACDQCQGSGHVKSAESVVLDVMRRLALVVSCEQVARIELTVSPDVAFQLLNRRRAQLVQLESRRDTPVMVRVNAGGPIDYVSLECFDSRGSVVAAESKALAHAGSDWSASLAEVETLRQQEREAELLEEETLEAEAEDQEHAEAEAEAQDDEALEQEEPAAREPEASKPKFVWRGREDQQREPAEAQPVSAQPPAARPAGEGQADQAGEGGEGGEGGERRRRRRRRGGRRRRRGGATAEHQGQHPHPHHPRHPHHAGQSQPQQPPLPAPAAQADTVEDSDEPNGNVADPEPQEEPVDDSLGNAVTSSPQEQPQQGEAKRRRRRRRGGRGRGRNKAGGSSSGGNGHSGDQPAAPPQPASIPAQPLD